MKYRHHKYTYTKDFGTPQHRWELVGPLGAVDFHVSLTEGYSPSAGLEFHHSLRCNYRTNEAPDHVKCWLTGGPCWHDGTSLYATETLWPKIEMHLQTHDHDTIFKILEGEASNHFAQFIKLPEPS